jgi:hypothetical protein
MDKKTVFVKTNTGESEVNGQSDALFGDAKRILLLVDDESTVGEISKRAPPSLREALNAVLQELVDGGYIRDMRAPVNVPPKPTLKMATPAFKMATPKAPAPSMAPPSPPATPKEIPKTAAPSNVAKPSMSMPDMTMPSMPTMPAPDIKKEDAAKLSKNSDLDFSFITSGSSPNQAVPDAAQEKVKAEAMARARQEADRLKVEQAAQIEAIAQAAKLKAYEAAKEKAKIEVAMKAKIEAESRLKNEAEAARQKAEQEVMKARTELEVTKARVEAEVRTRIEAEAKVKQELEAVRLKAEREAEQIRVELEAAKIKAETEMRIRIEAEARAKAEMEARLKREAEAERLKIQKERAEQEAAKAKAEAEIRMRTEAEIRVRAEVEARLKAEALAQERAKAELEAKIKREAEAEIKMRAEAEARVRAEVEARLKAEELARQREKSQSAARSDEVIRTQAREAQADPAEKLRQSFVESFGQDKKNHASSTGSFKLDKFSFGNTGKIPAIPEQNIKPAVLPAGGSKVKAAIEQRAQKEAEALRIKAEQEAAQLKAVQDETTRIKAEQDALRRKAEHEAYRLKVEQEEAQAKADAEARKLTDQQSRQWEEGQQRAVIQAQAEKERLAKQAAEAQAKSQQKPSRGPRKPLPVGKIVASVFALVLFAVAALPYLWPLDEYIAPLEQEISAQINQPIKISKINLALLPMPRLELHNVAIGSGQELKVGNAVLNFGISALIAPTKSISSVELSNINVAAASLDTAMVWLQAFGGIEKYPVSRLELRGLSVSGVAIKLPLLNGRAEFDVQGKFTRADLKSEDAKFNLELQSVQNRLKLELNVHESSLPILTNIKFNDMSVSGFVENGEFAFTDFFAHIHGGTLTGKGQLNWMNGWKLQGQINGRNLDIKRMFPNFSVSGELLGDINISMNAPVLSQLDKNPQIEGTFEAKNGVIDKIDIAAVARVGARQGVAGHTDFNELTGTIKGSSEGQRIYLSKFASTIVNGTGLLDVDSNQQLSGKLSMEVKGPNKGSVMLQLSGTAVEPALQSAR